MGILAPILLAGYSNRLITCFLLLQKIAITPLLRELVSAGICEEATYGKGVVVPGAPSRASPQ